MKGGGGGGRGRARERERERERGGGERAREVDAEKEKRGAQSSPRPLEQLFQRAVAEGERDSRECAARSTPLNREKRGKNGVTHGAGSFEVRFASRGNLRALRASARGFCHPRFSMHRETAH